MNILATMPGRHGDILWSLPTVRAISQTYGERVDFCISKKYGVNKSFLNLIQKQPYIRYCWADPEWIIEESAPITPRAPRLPIKLIGIDERLQPYEDELQYDEIFNLGYDKWPAHPLPAEIWDIANEGSSKPLRQIDLDTPWINPSWTIANPQPSVSVGWSDEWIELKMGVLLQAVSRLMKSSVYWGMVMPSWSRQREWLEVLPEGNFSFHVSDNWQLATAVIRESHCFLGCLSSQWVLANALGVPTVIMEPNPQRHNPIFYLDRPRNHMVNGPDLGSTFDARSTVELLSKVLKEVYDAQNQSR